VRGNPKDTTCRKVVRNRKPTVWPESRTTNASRSLDVFSAIRNRRRAHVRLPIPEDCPFLTLECQQPPPASDDSNLNELSERRRIVAQVRRAASQESSPESRRFAAQKKRAMRRFIDNGPLTIRIGGAYNPPTERGAALALGHGKFSCLVKLL